MWVNSRQTCLDVDRVILLAPMAASRFDQPFHFRWTKPLVLNLTFTLLRTISLPLVALAMIGVGDVGAQTSSIGADVASRLRPIGSPSAVDRYQNQRRVFPSSQIQLTQFEFPGSLPAGDPVVESPRSSIALPPALPGRSTNISPPPSNPATPLRQLPRANPPAAPLATGNPATGNPAFGNNFSGGSTLRNGFGDASDLTPISPPQIGNEFATANNSALVVPPGQYNAAMAVPSIGQCGAFYNPVGFNAGGFSNPSIAAPASGSVFGDPGVIGSPAIAAAPPGSVAPAGALISLGQSPSPIEIGRGLIGQPKAYVQGQPVRNWLRYFTP